jgi:hypothetical protein
MITHIKKNAQNIRGFTKPSHIESALQFGKRTLFLTHNFDCKKARRGNLYIIERDRGVSKLNEYIRKMEKRCNIFSSYGGF